MSFTEEQIERYSRQIILDKIGGKGQKKLLASKVLVIGTGGLGSPASFYLAAAGIGTLGILDSDNVELNNLQRQIIHFTKDVGKPKVLSAKQKLEALNPDIKIVTYHTKVDSSNIREIIKDYDFILDCTDNFPSRYLINDACILEKKPFSHAGILRFDGQAITIIPDENTPCYRCLFPEPPPSGLVPNCQQAGIIGSVAGILGLIQANEAIKYILEIGQLLTGRLLIINTLEWSFRIVRIRKNENCLLCGKEPTIKGLIDYEEFCGLRRKNN